MTNMLARLFDRKTRAARKGARAQLKSAKRLLRRGGKTLSETARQDIEDARQALAQLLREGRAIELDRHADKLEALLDKHLALYKKPAWRESFESIAIAILIALLIRSFVIEAFKIPSGSMIPTLAIGDQIFVNKYVYGIRIPFTSIRLVNFSPPKRGDVVVFKAPIEPYEDYIKRIIGLPGDEIMVRGGVPFINGKPFARAPKGRVVETERDGVGGPWHSLVADAFREETDGKSYTVLHDAAVPSTAADYGPFVVPPEHVFVMGDNRDRSFDSRSWGPVAIANILGRSMFVWWSWGKDGLNYKRIGTWIE